MCCQAQCRPLIGCRAQCQLLIGHSLDTCHGGRRGLGDEGAPLSQAGLALEHTLKQREDEDKVYTDDLPPECFDCLLPVEAVCCPRRGGKH